MNRRYLGGRALAVALALAVYHTAPGYARVPAGPGGFEWLTATPQGNNLHSVAAIPSTFQAAVTAVGDASTILYHRTPLGQPTGAWDCAHGFNPRTDVA